MATHKPFWQQSAPHLTSCHIYQALQHTHKILLPEQKTPKPKSPAPEKPLPHLRLLEKYAVLQGGGTPHRLSLKDGILIKDNHIIKAGSIIYAITQAKQKHPNKQIEIEIDTPAQIEDAIQAGADRILLDNMDIKTLTKAIELIKGRTLIEVSGNIELNNIAKIAQLGVDYISVGALTHSAPILDMGLDFPPSHPTQK